MTQANNETQAALIRHDRLSSVADIAGTFLFAIEGATAPSQATSICWG